MNKQTITLKQIIALCLIPLLFVLCWTLYNSLTFRITNVSPDTKNVSYINPYFKVSFNKEIKKEGLIITSSDERIIRNSDIKGNTLTITLNEMEIGKKYIITLAKISAKNGKILQDKALVFTADDTPFDKLSKELQQGIINNQSYFTDNQSDPILDYMPASSLHYTITPVFNGTNLTLNIQILLAKSDLGVQRNEIIEQYKQEALSYIKSIGFDTNKYVLSYSISEPSLY